MDIITSADNRTVKHINKLKQKKYRDEYAEFFTEGYKNVLDTCSARPDLVKYVVISESAYAETGGNFGDFDTAIVSDAVFGKLAETENSQGVLSVNRIPDTVFPTADRCILLDRVRDPGNVGTILRTALACDYDVIVNNCADVYSPKTVRSAMSAVVKCRIGKDILPSDIKKAGYELIAADMHGGNMFETETCAKYCIVIGNEAEGVDRGIIEIADRTLCIPQNNIESLNAAVAAAVMMFGLRYAVK